MKLNKKVIIGTLGFIISFENSVLAIYTSAAINILTSGSLKDLFYLTFFTLISLAAIFGFKILFQKVKHQEIGKMNVGARTDLIETFLSGFVKELPMNMLFNDVKFLEDNYYDKKIEQYLNVISFLLSFITSLLLGWEATLIIVLLSLFAIFLPKMLQKKITQKTNRWSEENDSYMNTAKDIINGNKAIQNYSTGDYFIGKHAEAVTHLEKKNVELKVFQKVVEFLTFSVSHLAIISMVLASGWLVMNGKMQLGNIIGIIQLSNSITFPLVVFAKNQNLIQSAKDIFKRQRNFIGLNQEQVMDKQSIDQVFETIELSNVNYTVNDQPILEDINLTINRGEKILLLGPSGSGKSTLLSLLNGENWENAEGKIIVNKKEIKPKSLKSFTSRIMQDYYIFEDTLINNICFGKEYSEEIIDNALHMAQLEEVVQNKGFDYEVTDNGKNLSGGQKQRIEIVRSLITNKPILLVDEGLSSLDKTTGEVIEGYFLNADKTMVHVTHHINEKYLGKYDIILSIENGKLGETSTVGGGN